MIYLIFCILSSTGIFLTFRFLDKHKIPSFPVILLNYIVASVFGFLINPVQTSIAEILSQPWFFLSIFIGFLFIVMFFIIARSSSEAGISITTVASKMSVVFPISISILIEPTDHLTLIKGTAILAALAGVLLTIYQKGIVVTDKRLMIPLILFVGMGAVDSLVKYSQHKFVGSEDAALFSAVLFAMAFLTGLIFIPFRTREIKSLNKAETWLWGLGLGIVNFGSIYLMVSALNYVNEQGRNIDSSVIFGVNNIGIVSLSVIAGLIIFKEKLSTIN